MLEAPFIKEVSHTGMIVADADSCAESFCKVMGSITFDVYDYRPFLAWCGGKPVDNVHFHVAMGTLPNGSKMELVQPVSGDTPQMTYLKQVGEGMNHVACVVDDYESCKQWVIEQGYEILMEGHAFDQQRRFRRSLFIEDPGMKCMVEFYQRTEEIQVMEAP